jgi:O-antigen/teichoic acid export membrane protein
MNSAWSFRRQKDAIVVPVETAVALGESSSAAKQPRYDADKARGVYPLYIVANVTPRIAMVVVLIVLTRLLPLAEYGLFALVVTTGEILEMASGNWIRLYLLRTEAGRAKLRPRRLGRAVVLSAGATLAGLATSMLVIPFISDGRTAEMTAAVIVYIMAFALLRTTLTLLQLSRNHRAFAAVECGRGLANVAATVIVAIIHPHSFFPTSIALSLTTGASAALGLALSARYLTRPIFPRGGYFVALAFGVPYVAANTLFYTIGWFDRFVLNYFHGPATVAVYVAAYAIARQPVDLFLGALNSFTFPLLVHAYANGGAQKAGPLQSGLLTTMTLLGIGIVAGLSLLAEPLAALLFPPVYRADAAVLVPWIVTATFILSIKQFIFDNTLHATQQNWLHLVTMIPSVIVSIGFGILLVRNYGLFGAAINYMVVSIIAMLSAAIISFKIFAFKIPWRDFLKIAIAALAASAATWLGITHFAWGMVPTLIAGATVFCGVYGIVLALQGFSLKQLIETPWAPLANRAQANSTSSNRVR